MDAVSSERHAEVTARLLNIIAKEGLVDGETLSLDSRLDTLGIKSADVVVILLAIEDEFNIYVPIDDQLSNATTVKDLVDSLISHIEQNAAAATRSA